MHTPTTTRMGAVGAATRAFERPAAPAWPCRCRRTPLQLIHRSVVDGDASVAFAPWGSAVNPLLCPRTLYWTSRANVGTATAASFEQDRSALRLKCPRTRTWIQRERIGVASEVLSATARRAQRCKFQATRTSTSRATTGVATSITLEPARVAQRNVLANEHQQRDDC